MTLYRIIFTPFGASQPAQIWEGYTSRAEVRAALRDADSIIPIHWDHETEEYEAETEEWSGSPCPLDPDNFWINDATGERIPA
jgi:hypothetical protein